MDASDQPYVFLSPTLRSHIRALKAALDKLAGPGDGDSAHFDVGDEEDGEEGDDIDVDDPQFDYIPDEDEDEYVPPTTGDGDESEDDQDSGYKRVISADPYRPSSAWDPAMVDAGAYEEPLPHNEEIHKLVHSLLFDLFEQPVNEGIPAGQYHPIPLFLTLIGITPSGDFKPLEHIPPLLAQFQYGIRITVTHEIIIRHAQYHPPPSKQPLMSTASELAYLVHDDQDGTAFNEVRQALTSASRVVRLTPTRPRFMACNPDATIFEFDGKKNHVRNLTEMSQGLLGTLEKKVLRLFKTGGVTAPQLPTFDDILDIKDDVNNKEPGYSVFHDPKLPLHHFRTAFATNLALNDKFVTVVDGEEHYVKYQWQRLSKMIRIITELLFVCCHLMCGAVSRGTSISADTYANPERGLRNFCWSDTGGIFYSAFCKVSDSRGYDKVIVRSQPPRLSYITLLYLLVIRPLDLFITREFIKPKFKDAKHLTYLANTYIFFTGGIILTTSDLTRILRHWTSLYLGTPYSTSDIRQIWCYLKDHFVCRPRHTRFIANHIALQSGHGAVQAKRWYGVSAPRGAPMSQDTELFKRSSEQYHLYLGISGLDVMDVACMCHVHVWGLSLTPLL